jgi:hypothetical protein
MDMRKMQVKQFIKHCKTIASIRLLTDDAGENKCQDSAVTGNHDKYAVKGETQLTVSIDPVGAIRPFRMARFDMKVASTGDLVRSTNKWMSPMSGTSPW